jgi:hypothetical protein
LLRGSWCPWCEHDIETPVRSPAVETFTIKTGRAFVSGERLARYIKACRLDISSDVDAAILANGIRSLVDARDMGMVPAGVRAFVHASDSGRINAHEFLEQVIGKVGQTAAGSLEVPSGDSIGWFLACTREYGPDEPVDVIIHFDMAHRFHDPDFVLPMWRAAVVLANRWLVEPAGETMRKAIPGRFSSTAVRDIVEGLLAKQAAGHEVMQRQRRAEARPRLSIADLRAAALRHGGECLSRALIAPTMPVAWRCSDGHEWEAAPAQVLAGRWCRRCAKERAKRAYSAKNLEVMVTLARKHGGALLSTSFSGPGKALSWRCAEGHEWQATPRAIERGAWCKVCASRAEDNMRMQTRGEEGYTITDARSLAREHWGSFLSDDSIGPRLRLQWRCASGHEFTATYHKAKRAWCPLCRIAGIKHRVATPSEVEVFLKEKAAWHPKVVTMMGSRYSFSLLYGGFPTMPGFEGVVMYGGDARWMIAESGARWAVLVPGFLEEAGRLLAKVGMGATHMRTGSGARSREPGSGIDLDKERT